MKNMKLSIKLTGSSLIVACLIMVMGYIGISRVGLMNKAGLEIQESNVKPLGYISNMAVAFQREGGYIRDVLLDQFIYVKDVNPDVAKIKELDQKIKENSEKFSKALTSGEDRKIVENLKMEMAQFISVRDKLIESIKGGLLGEARNLLQGDIYTRAEKIASLLDKLSDLQIKSVQKKMEQNSQTSAAASWLTWIIGGLGTLLAAALGIFLTFSVARPVRRVVDGIKEGAEQVSGAAAQVSSASQSLAEGSSRQAAGLEETSSSLEEMSAMTKQNADNAQQARVMMSEAGQIVGNVSHHMGQMAEAIGEITKSSEDTGKIVKTIDEIAFQTNLLALNAAVEAARAGEAGAGFAVVADEVRNLAMRAAEAAKNTSNLIENTIKSVKSGNELTLATQDAFKKNVDISNKISRLIDEIAAASQEQAQGISQLNQAVTEIDKVTQQNAANAEESASAAEEMTSQALQFKEFVKDLAAVLEGSRNGNGGGPSKGFRPNNERTTPRSNSKSFPEKGERRTLTAFDPRGKKAAPIPRPKHREITAEQIIPMEEDFKEF